MSTFEDDFAELKDRCKQFNDKYGTAVELVYHLAPRPTVVERHPLYFSFFPEPGVHVDDKPMTIHLREFASMFGDVFDVRWVKENVYSVTFDKLVEAKSCMRTVRDELPYSKLFGVKVFSSFARTW